MAAGAQVNAANATGQTALYLAAEYGHADAIRELARLGADLAARKESGATAMHAAAYGPFHVRNEVDKHADIIGADFDNAKFLTGDGGFLQLLMNGYGALRVVDHGLLLRAAPAPPGADAARMRMRGVTWHGRVFDLDATRARTVVSLAAGGADAAVVDGGGACAPIAAGESVALDAGSFFWPALFVEKCPAGA